jgi:toxin secretion/phage lysis holin
MREIINSITACVMTVITVMFGTWDIAITILIGAIVLDYITGVMAGAYNHNLSSEIGFKGLLKKIMILICVMVGVMVDKLLGQGTWVFRTMICYFYFANECISLLENATKMGLKIPKKLISLLEQFQKEGDTEDGK